MPQFPVNLSKSTRNRKKNGYNEPLLQEYFNEEERMEQNNAQIEDDKTGEALSVVIVEVPHNNNSNYFSNSTNDNNFISNPYTCEHVMANEANFNASDSHIAFYPNENHQKKKKSFALYTTKDSPGKIKN